MLCCLVLWTRKWKEAKKQQSYPTQQRNRKTVQACDIFLRCCHKNRPDLMTIFINHICWQPRRRRSGWCIISQIAQTQPTMFTCAQHTNTKTQWQHFSLLPINVVANVVDEENPAYNASSRKSTAIFIPGSSIFFSEVPHPLLLTPIAHSSYYN